MEKQLFSTILIVGGTTAMSGFMDTVEDRVFRNLPMDCDIHRVEVNMKKEIDSRLITLR